MTGTTDEIDARLSSVLLEFVESHMQLQGSFDRASAEIAEAVKAIDERNKAKSKSKATSSKNASEADAKIKPDGDPSKLADTLPLWWTDSSVSPPGTAVPDSSSMLGHSAESSVSNEPKKPEEVAGNVGTSNNA